MPFPGGNGKSSATPQVPQGREEALLLLAHAGGLAGGAMVVPSQMKYPMDEQAIQGDLDRLPGLGRLPLGFIHGYDHLSEVAGGDVRHPGAGPEGLRPFVLKRKRQNIGGVALAPELPVQQAHGPIAHNGDADVLILAPELFEYCLGPLPESRKIEPHPPLPV